MENALRSCCEPCGHVTVWHAKAVLIRQFSLDTRLGSWYLATLGILTKKTLRGFKEQPPYRDVEQPLQARFTVANAETLA